MTLSFFHIKTALRLARREIRGGFKGFYIFLACIALGTASIAAVNSISQAITSAIHEEGQSILGADVRFGLRNRIANDEELKYFESLGQVAVSTGLRSMVRLPDGSQQTLAEVKSVDQAYPLYGTFEATPQLPLSDLLKKNDAGFGTVVAPILLERLSINVGDTLLLGNTPLTITGTITKEPDAMSEGFGFAPRIMISSEAIAASGLVQTGSLVEHDYKVKLDDTSQRLTIADTSKAKFPDAGWSLRTSDRAAPALTQNVERFSQFLTLVGLTALIVGGVGVANAVRAFLDEKRTTIASLKCLGAPATIITLTYLIQISFIAIIGIVAGLIVGVATPLIAMHYLDGVLPVPNELAFYPQALILAASFGFITTIAFTILPLGKAREVPATAMFREQSFDDNKSPALPYRIVTAVLLALLIGLAFYTSTDHRIASVFIGAIFFAFIILRIVATVIKIMAKRSPRVKSTALRLAIANIHRPGALTSSVVLSLGLGLTLLVTIAVIDGNLRKALTSNLPERAPNFFFVDIQSSQATPFASLIDELTPDGKLIQVPMLRGRITELNNQDVTKIEVPSEGRWVLRGDRGITYAKRAPENGTLTEGEWWSEDYTGEPLVSFAAKEAEELGLKIGDTVTVNVLGRNITAKISNFRKVEWESLAINFVMIFSPNTFQGAPHSWLATLTIDDANADAEGSILRKVTTAFPTVTTIRVKDALDIVNELVGQLALAIRAAASVALMASILVLAGALAAGNRTRTHDAVILKTLGATRVTLLKAFTYEYFLLGASTAIFALLAGSTAAWFVVTKIMKLPFIILPELTIFTVIIALLLTIGMGLIGTWRILGQKAAPILRNTGE